MLPIKHPPKTGAGAKEANDRHTPGAKDTTDRYTPERVNAFSDAVFAVIITLMVLDLKKPAGANWHSLASLWPVLLSYIVSYLFIAIVWVNHHYLLKSTTRATPRLIWANFAHLFSVSFVPFLTSWIAETEFQPLPVAMYAFVFLLVNITYLIFVWESLSDDSGNVAPGKVRQILHIRSFITISLFAAALVISFWWPKIGFTIICLCLLLYLRPEASRTA